jgi:hypothetical protein
MTPLQPRGGYRVKATAAAASAAVSTAGNMIDRTPRSSTCLTMTGSFAHGTRTMGSAEAACAACSCASTEGSVLGACSMSMTSHESPGARATNSVTCGEPADAQRPSRGNPAACSSGRVRAAAAACSACLNAFLLGGAELSERTSLLARALSMSPATTEQHKEPTYGAGFQPLRHARVRGKRPATSYLAPRLPAPAWPAVRPPALPERL